MFRKFGLGLARSALSLAGGWLLVGCGATGLAWVDEPEPASGWSNSEARGADVSSPRAPGAPIPATADADPAPENHQRLNHTVTLGDIAAAAPAAQAQAPYGPAVSVTINNYGQVGAPAPGYAGYYPSYASFAGGRGGAGFARSGGGSDASRASGSSLQPGQNWPSVADHGSSFPYHTGPASPWSGAGRSQ